MINGLDLRFFFGQEIATVGLCPIYTVQHQIFKEFYSSSTTFNNHNRRPVEMVGRHKEISIEGQLLYIHLNYVKK
jgi:hypothetical protein